MNEKSASAPTVNFVNLCMRGTTVLISILWRTAQIPSRLHFGDIFGPVTTTHIIIAVLSIPLEKKFMMSPTISLQQFGSTYGQCDDTRMNVWLNFVQGFSLVLLYEQLVMNSTRRMKQ